MCEKKRSSSTGKTPRTVEESLRKLAMGSVNDSVKLVIQSSEDPVSIDGLDLFNIKEIRTNKDGIEIKFYDRLEALKCLDMLQHRLEEKEEGRKMLLALSGESEPIEEDAP
ncbi:terminase small subunit [Zongyangia hominis]|uniref:Uncharacterized protein n=1 Tax=Zongyangia hominis TaxID=2763677 RepID=A0A926EDR1_9FIRM|nr:terminase small subunit [Zongyangia hominis]MBC8570544.1 hypothetical protein [Zongyangia hominis]